MVSYYDNDIVIVLSSSCHSPLFLSQCGKCRRKCPGSSGGDFGLFRFFPLHEMRNRRRSTWSSNWNANTFCSSAKNLLVGVWMCLKAWPTAFAEIHIIPTPHVGSECWLHAMFIAVNVAKQKEARNSTLDSSPTTTLRVPISQVCPVYIWGCLWQRGETFQCCGGRLLQVDRLKFLL